MENKYIYISDQEHLEVPQLSEIQINNKVLKCPFYGVLIRNNVDVECLKDVVNSRKLKNTHVVAYNLGDAEEFKKKITKTLFELTGEKLSYKPFSEFVITIDPVGEYLQYNVKSEVEKLLLIQDLPESAKSILKLSGDKRKIAIKEIFEDEKSLSGLVEWYLRKSLSLNASIGIPVCIPISGKSTLNYAIKTNRIATTIQQDNGWQKAVYFLLDFKAFKNFELMNSIIASINVLQPSIVVFKILNHKFFEPNNSLERNNLNIFLEDLYSYRTKTKALTFAINCDSILYHYMAQGLCGVIEPISGNYNPDIRRRASTVDLEDNGEGNGLKNFGKYPDPLLLEEKPYPTLQVLNRNSGELYPCHCHECSKQERFIQNSFEYNKFRRRHRLHIRDMFISEIKQSFIDNNTRVAMFDRFNEPASQLSSFRIYYS